MSSILDALKKLEAERAEAKKVTDEHLADHVAERDLVGRSSLLRKRFTLRFSPVTMVLGGILAALAVVGASVAVSILVLNRTPAETPALTATAKPARSLKPVEEAVLKEPVQEETVAKPATPETPSEPKTEPPAKPPEVKPEPVGDTASRRRKGCGGAPTAQAAGSASRCPGQDRVRPAAQGSPKRDAP